MAKEDLLCLAELTRDCQTGCGLCDRAVGPGPPEIRALSC